MFYRLCLLLLCVYCFSTALLADGIAIGRGFTPQLLETHQWAIISLTETSADVSMFIAIEGIPTGQQITYILPFWYKPNGFTLKEEDSGSFRNKVVTPASKRVLRSQRITSHQASTALATIAPYVGIGLPSLISDPFLSMYESHANKRMSQASVVMISPALIPYSTSETAHARVELYEIGKNDLQQLLKQSELPTKYLHPLLKYHTPFFAVMHLIGLTSAEKSNTLRRKTGICYHFTHQIASQYTYPLGTGAAWPQPIPLTEVYITCPDQLALHVQAPTEGEIVYKDYFYDRATELMNYLARSAAERKKYYSYASNNELQEILSPKTTSELTPANQNAFAWHIGYMQSNPDKDIYVHISKQPAPWRLAIADFFTAPNVPLITCLILLLFSWLVAALLVWRSWKHAGKPGNFFTHLLITFVIVQFYTLFITCIVGLLPVQIKNNYSIYPNSPMYYFPSWLAPFFVIFITGTLLTAVILYARKQTIWPKWFSLLQSIYRILLVTIVSSSLLFLIVCMLHLSDYQILPQSYKLTVWSTIIFLLFSVGCLIVAEKLIPRPATDNWRKWLPFTSWLCSSVVFSILVVLLYNFLHWCETIQA